jgi:hypothetical protein
VKSINSCTRDPAVEPNGHPHIGDATGHASVILNCCVTCGLLLGIGLLAQMISTYRFVSSDLVQQEAQHETIRKISALEQMVRGLGARGLGTEDTGQLSQIVDATVRKSPTQIAWLRILQLDGTPVAAVGLSAEKLYSRARMHEAIENHNILSRIVNTPSGRVLVTVRPLRAAPGPFSGAANGEGHELSSRPLIVEIAIYMDSVAAPFGPLRLRVLTGIMAALALVIAMIVIGLRFGSYLRGKQLQQQADAAHTVQLDLMSPTESIPKDLDFAGACIPAWQVGGDSWDVCADKSGRIGLMLTDVAGKGVPAALLSSLIQGVIRAASWTSDAQVQAGTVRQLNDFLCARSAPERFASMVWCYYSPVTSTLKYVNAGHLPPIVVHKGQNGTFSAQRLQGGGPVLGVLPGYLYLEGEVTVGPGDLLVSRFSNSWT